MPFLSGFKLIDTPGPNEWESASFNTIALKQTALEVLRTCNAILFILDYTSFKDNTNSELLQELIEKRSDFLAQNRGKIYFVLNKIDIKSEKDRPIDDVIKDLKNTLIGFGIPEPMIYPASAWKGLLAKLIQKKIATPEDKADFKNFFIAKYIEEDEDGDIVVPKLKDIAPKALEDSGITTIENAVIQTVVNNSGWNLLSDVLAIFNKSAQSVEETLITEIRGWEVEFEALQKEIDGYKQHSDSARQKVAIVKKSVEEQKQILINKFNQGVNQFAEKAKKEIAVEINKVAKNSKKNSSKHKEKTLWSLLVGAVTLFSGHSESDPYKIRVKDKKEAEKVGKLINQYCTPIIHNFWLDTQDSLVREGTKIREGLVQKIQQEIQAISDKLSEYIGQSLEVDINTNPIQFPKFEFSGIDAKIQQQQEVFTKTKKETRKKSRCCKSDKVYEVDVDYQETISFYEIDLRLTLQGIHQKIDEQVERNQGMLERVIQKQVSEDFWKAERQINDYINRFQFQFDQLLKERATREIEAPDIVAKLENQRIKVSEYLNELISIQEMLNAWRVNTYFSNKLLSV
ncbi:MAG: dynamin family protein [Calothrix sp. MO_167.B12]|nr:dynamin family protein [Calothrix sp. MO_167.B12]